MSKPGKGAAPARVDPTGAARNKRLRDKLAESGGRAITVRLSAEAAIALDKLAVGTSKNAALCAALIAAAKGAG